MVLENIGSSLVTEKIYDYINIWLHNFLNCEVRIMNQHLMNLL